MPPNSKIGKKIYKKNDLLDARWHKNLPRFQGARPDHENSSGNFKLLRCFPRVLLSVNP